MTRTRSLLIVLTPLLVVTALVVAGMSYGQALRAQGVCHNDNGYGKPASCPCSSDEECRSKLCTPSQFCAAGCERYAGVGGCGGDNCHIGKICVRVGMNNVCLPDDGKHCQPYCQADGPPECFGGDDVDSDPSQCCQRGTCIGIGGGSYFCTYPFVGSLGGGTRYSNTACTPATQSTDCVECAVCTEDQKCDATYGCRSLTDQEQQTQQCAQSEIDLTSAQSAHDTAESAWEDARAAWDDAQDAWNDAKDAYVEAKTVYKETIDACNAEYTQARSDCADEEISADRKACLTAAKAERIICKTAARSDALQAKDAYAQAKMDRTSAKTAYSASKTAWRGAERALKDAQKAYDKAVKECGGE
ncbi:MAG: hypothetical protein PHH13_00465 [Candidatus Peribacteraceae bacterium]|nr:hypothetical protein [Candidatus Peribacteraceae bacterium]